MARKYKFWTGSSNQQEVIGDSIGVNGDWAMIQANGETIYVIHADELVGGISSEEIAD